MLRQATTVLVCVWYTKADKAPTWLYSENVIFINEVVVANLGIPNT